MPLLAAVGVTISPTTATVNQGATKQFTATVSGTTTTTVKWTVSTGGGTVSTSGLYMAPAKAGTYTVTATSTVDTTKSASATITVPAVGITVSPTTATVVQGGTQTFTGAVTGTTNTAVTWSATGGTFSGSTWTAPKVAGTYTITGTSSADTTKKATATITVPAVGITISPTTGTVAPSGTQAFTGTVTGSVTTTVTWSATGGTFSGSTWTAPATPGSYTITGTATADSTKKATATMTVAAPVAVTMSPTTATVNQGATKQFTATVTGSTNTAVTWTVSTGGGTVSNTGLYTAPNVAGTYTVTATSAADSTKKATATVTVPSVGITLSPTTATVNPNQTAQFTATVTGTTNTAVNWSVTAGGGSISASGLYTASATAGTYTVTATSVADSTKKATATVTVPVVVTVSPATASVPKGGTKAYTAAVLGSTNLDATWAVSSGGGTITRTGIGTATYTAGSTTGTYTITATSVAATTSKGTASVTVTLAPPVITSFGARISGTTVYPTLALTEGDSATLAWSITGATSATLSNGASVSATSGTWGISAPSGRTTTTWTLTATNAAGSTTANVVIEGYPQPAVTSFAATPSSGVAGTAFQLLGTFTGGNGWVEGYDGTQMPITSGTPLNLAFKPGMQTLWLKVQNPAGLIRASTINISGLAPGTLTYLGQMTDPGTARFDSAVTTAALDPTGRPIALGLKYSTLSLLGLNDPPTTPLSSSLGTIPASTTNPTNPKLVTLLEDGRLLVVDGYGGNVWVLSPGSLVLQTYQAPWLGAVTTTDRNCNAVKLDAFRILIVGFKQGDVYIFDTRTNTFQSFARTNEARYDFDLALLPDGRVLLSGGYLSASAVITSDAKVFNPVGGTWAAAGSMGWGRRNHKSLRLFDGSILVAGGDGGLEWFNPATLTFTVIQDGNGPLSLLPRRDFSLFQVPDGRVLLVGGWTGTLDASSHRIPQNQVECFYPDQNAVIYGPSFVADNTGMGEAKFNPQAVQLPSGNVYILGGPGLGDFDGSKPGDVNLLNPGSAFVATPAIKSLYPGDTLQLSAGTESVTWGVVEGAGGTVSSSGLYTAPATPGLYHVKATSQSRSASSTVTLRVVQRPLGMITSFTADQTSISAGANVVLAPIFSGGTGTINGIGAVVSGQTYTVTPTQHTSYTLSVVDANGLTVTQTITITVQPIISYLTATPPVIAPGEVTNLAWDFKGATTASLTDGTTTWSVGPASGMSRVLNATKTFTLTVNTADGGASMSVTPIVSVVKDITISPATATLVAGTQVGLAGNLTVLSGQDQTVTWSSSGGTIQQTGSNGLSAIFTAPAGFGGNTYTVTVTSNADPLRSATATITVTPLVVQVTPSYLELNAGNAFQFGLQTNAGNVVWSASTGTIGQDGTYTAPSTPGTYTVTATSLVDPTSVATATVVVRTPQIVISPQSAVVGTSQTYRFAAVSTTGTLSWSVVEANGGSIAADGTYTAPSTSGTFHVKATVSGVSATASVVVIDGPSPAGGGGGSTGGTGPTPILGGVGIDPPIAMMRSGTYQAFSATVYGIDNQDVTWSVDGSPAGAKIDTDGSFTPSYTGSYVIRAVSKANGGLFGTATVLVSGSVDPIATVPAALNRQGYSVTALKNGKIWIAGGWDGTSYLNTCYLYDPATQAFTQSASLTYARSGHEAVLLDSGKVMIFSGIGMQPGGTQGLLYQAELFNPDTGAFEPLPANPAIPAAPGGTMQSPHDGGHGVKLGNGQVIAAGGGDGLGGNEGPSSLFDPQSNAFTKITTPTLPKWTASAALSDGRVLVTGGLGNVSGAPQSDADYHLKSDTWIYDPNAQPTPGYQPGPAMATKRAAHTATLLADGRVLVVGGIAHDNTPYNQLSARNFVPTATAEIFDPATGAFTPVGSMKWARSGHAAILLPSGQVLVAGGWSSMTTLPDGSSSNSYTTETELFDPSTKQWRVMDNLGYGIVEPILTLPKSGKIFITGKVISASATTSKGMPLQSHRIAFGADAVNSSTFGNFLFGMIEVESEIELKITFPKFWPANDGTYNFKTTGDDRPAENVEVVIKDDSITYSGDAAKWKGRTNLDGVLKISLAVDSPNSASFLVSEIGKKFTFSVRPNTEIDLGGGAIVRAKVVKGVLNSSSSALEYPVKTRTGGADNIVGKIKFEAPSLSAGRPSGSFNMLWAYRRALMALGPLAVSNKDRFDQFEFRWDPDLSDSSALAAGTTRFVPDNGRQVYVRGDRNLNSDDFDDGVIFHELGHMAHVVFGPYVGYPAPFGIPNDHASFGGMDPNLAWIEGWADFFPMVIQTSDAYPENHRAARYFDSGKGGVPTRPFMILDGPMDSSLIKFTGWENEMRVGRFLWKAYNDPLVGNKQLPVLLSALRPTLDNPDGLMAFIARLPKNKLSAVDALLEQEGFSVNPPSPSIMPTQIVLGSASPSFALAGQSPLIDGGAAALTVGSSAYFQCSLGGEKGALCLTIHGLTEKNFAQLGIVLTSEADNKITTGNVVPLPDLPGRFDSATGTWSATVANPGTRLLITLYNLGTTSYSGVTLTLSDGECK